MLKTIHYDIYLFCSFKILIFKEFFKKMCRKIFAISAFLFYSFNTLAKTSAEIRAEKIVSFNIHTGNKGVIFSDIGPSVSFFVKPWFSAGLSYRYNFLNPLTKGTRNELEKQDSSGLLSAIINNHTHHYFSLDATFYTGNSFYIKTGIGYDSISISSEKEYIRTSSFMLPIAIGNRWQWSFVNFGVEWLGFNIPFGQSFSSSPSIDLLLKAVQTPESIASMKKAATAIHTLKGVNFFTFSVGVAL